MSLSPALAQPFVVLLMKTILTLIYVNKKNHCYCTEKEKYSLLKQSMAHSAVYKKLLVATHGNGFVPISRRCVNVRKIREFLLLGRREVAIDFRKVFTSPTYRKDRCPHQLSIQNTRFRDVRAFPREAEEYCSGRER